MSYSHLPLTALRAFEATARLLSVKDAAAELHVTPTAISHQIQQLERGLGVTLFLRLHRGLALTPAATACLPQLKSGFEALHAAVQTLQVSDQDDMVSVSAPPSFAMRVLMPLTHDFLADHPEVDLRITTRMREPLRDIQAAADEIDVLRRWTEENDVVIVLGKGSFGELQAEQLLPLSLTVVCSPSWVASGQLTGLDDIGKLPWLHDDRGTKYGGVSFWSQWLDHAGLALPHGADNAQAPTAHYTHAAMAIDAAVRGKGLLVTTPSLCRAELRNGTLVAPFEISPGIDQAYYVLSRPGVRPMTQAFIGWLRDAVHRWSRA